MDINYPQYYELPSDLEVSSYQRDMFKVIQGHIPKFFLSEEPGFLLDGEALIITWTKGAFVYRFEVRERSWDDGIWRNGVSVSYLSFVVSNSLYREAGISLTENLPLFSKGMPSRKFEYHRDLLKGVLHVELEKLVLGEMEPTELALKLVRNLLSKKEIDDLRVQLDRLEERGEL